MGKYTSLAENIANRAAKVQRQRKEQEQTNTRTAKDVVCDLDEFAADVNAALKKNNVKGQLSATPWVKDVTDEIASTLTIKNENRECEVRIALSFAGDITVNGKRVDPSQGDTPMNAICKEVVDVLIE